ncbi:MAG: hypothetical protein FWE22_03795 [Firmicutes bacterium]|nr:hypothetical protein [Bacillota bacterium]
MKIILFLMQLISNQVVQMSGHYLVKDSYGNILGTMILKAGDIVPPTSLMMNYLELIEK